MAVDISSLNLRGEPRVWSMTPDGHCTEAVPFWWERSTGGSSGRYGLSRIPGVPDLGEVRGARLVSECLQTGRRGVKVLLTAHRAAYFCYNSPKLEMEELA